MIKTFQVDQLQQRKAFAGLSFICPDLFSCEGKGIITTSQTSAFAQIISGQLYINIHLHIINT